MSDIHDDAMTWAQANPQDHRAQDIMAKAWAAKNPQDPRSAAIMQKFNGPATPSPTDEMKQTIKDPFSTLTPGQKKITDGIMSGGVGDVATLGGEMLQKPASALGDFLMQKAVGIKKFIPGVGKTLGEEGLIGTKSMMAKQAEKGLAQRGKEIGDLTSSIPEVSTDTPSQAVLDKAQKLVQRDGYISPQDRPQYRNLSRLSDDIAARGGDEGVVTGSVAQNARANAGTRAREAGAYRDNPAQTLKAKAASTEQYGWSQALKDAYAKMNPENPQALSQADSAYSALSRADSAMSKQPSALSQFLNVGARTGIGASIGGAVGGKDGAEAGSVIGLAAGTPLVKSLAGRALLSPAPKVLGTGLQQMLTRKPNTGQ